MTGGTYVYNGAPQMATASVVGLDGVTPVAGTTTFLYNGQTYSSDSGAPSGPSAPGTYTVEADFASSDPNYSSSSGFGTLYRVADNGSVPLDPASTEVLPIDLAANAETLGARVVRAATVGELREALAGARGAGGPVVVYVETDRYRGVPSYEGWWDVPVAEVSEEDGVRSARASYEREHERQRQYLRSAYD